MSFLIDLFALFGARDRLDSENDPASEEQEDSTYDPPDYSESDD